MGAHGLTVTLLLIQAGFAELPRDADLSIAKRVRTLWRAEVSSGQRTVGIESVGSHQPSTGTTTNNFSDSGNFRIRSSAMA